MLNHRLKGVLPDCGVEPFQVDVAVDAIEEFFALLGFLKFCFRNFSKIHFFENFQKFSISYI